MAAGIDELCREALLLLIYDLEGTVILPQEGSYTRFIDAANILFPRNEFPGLRFDWDRIFTITAGTSDDFLLETVCRIANVPPQSIKKEWNTLIHEGEFKHNEYYTFVDAVNFANYFRLNRNINRFPAFSTVQVLGTGNNELTANYKADRSKIGSYLDKDGQKYLGGFGEESSRTNIIFAAIRSAVSHGFRPLMDSNGYLINVAYLGDTINDRIAAADAKVLGVTVQRDKTKLRMILDAFSLTKYEVVCPDLYVQRVCNLCDWPCLLSNPNLNLNDNWAGPTYEYPANQLHGDREKYGTKGRITMQNPIVLRMINENGWQILKTI